MGFLRAEGNNAYWNRISIPGLMLSQACWHQIASRNLKWTAFAHLCVSESLTTVQHFQKMFVHLQVLLLCHYQSDSRSYMMYLKKKKKNKIEEHQKTYILLFWFSIQGLVSKNILSQSFPYSCLQQFLIHLDDLPTTSVQKASFSLMLPCWYNSRTEHVGSQLLHSLPIRFSWFHIAKTSLQLFFLQAKSYNDASRLVWKLMVCKSSQAHGQLFGKYLKIQHVH